MFPQVFHMVFQLLDSLSLDDFLRSLPVEPATQSVRILVALAGFIPIQGYDKCCDFGWNWTDLNPCVRLRWNNLFLLWSSLDQLKAKHL